MPSEEFLDLQLADAKDEIARTKQALMDTGISEDAITSGGKSLEKKIILLGADCTLPPPP